MNYQSGVIAEPPAGHDAITDRRTAIQELMHLTENNPETATERAETAAQICSLLGALFKLPIPTGNSRT